MYNHKNTAEVHYIHTSSSPGLHTDITDTTEQAANRRVTASRLGLTFPFSNIQAPSFPFSPLLQHLQSFLVSRNRYRKKSLVVVVHTLARNVSGRAYPLTNLQHSLLRPYMKVAHTQLTTHYNLLD